MIIHSNDNPAAINYSRIISLVPSQTELLYDLGLAEKVIGITKFCVHPDVWFRNKPRVGGTKNLNLNKIAELSPDLIIANKEENVKEQIEELSGMCDILLTDVNDLNDALEMIRKVGVMTGTAPKAEDMIKRISVGFDALRTRDDLRNNRVAYFIWKKPYMVAGSDTFINDMLERCGFENVFEDLTRYPEIEPGTLTDRHCDTILLSSEPYPFREQDAQELQDKLPGVKILFVDGEMFSWYGSRLIAAAAYFDGLLKDHFDKK